MCQRKKDNNIKSLAFKASEYVIGFDYKNQPLIYLKVIAWNGDGSIDYWMIGKYSETNTNNYSIQPYNILNKNTGEFDMLSNRESINKDHLFYDKDQAINRFLELFTN